MGTEKFMAFKEDGTAYRLKGRILRFLDAEPVSSSDKSNMRSSLGITSQGGLGDLLAANNLDDVANAATSRSNLDVNSVAQDAESDGIKLVGPEMHFDGTSYIEFAANPALTPTTGSGATRQDTAFSFGTWLKLKDDYELSIGQYGTSAANRGWLLYMDSSSSPKFKFAMEDGSANEMRVTSSTDYFVSGQWTHIAVTCTALSAASARQNDIKIYVNGKEIATTSFNVGYTGLTYSATQPLLIGKRSSTISSFSQRDFKFFNKALSASEVKTLCLSGSLPESFAESTGSAEIYAGDSSTFAGGLGNWTEEGSTSLTLAASGGEMVITNTSGASGGTKGARNLTDNVVEGKKLRLTFTSRCSSGTATGFTVKMFNGSQATSATKIQGSGTASTGSSAIYSFTPTGSNETHIVEFVLAGAATDNLYFNLSADGTGEVYNFDNITLTQIGSVLDARAENYNQSANKLLDVTANNFVGTGSGVSIINPRTHISAETLDLTNLPTSDSGLSAGEVYNDSGTLKIKL